MYLTETCPFYKKNVLDRVSCFENLSYFKIRFLVLSCLLLRKRIQMARRDKIIYL